MGLEKMIEEKKFYPITFLKNLNKGMIEKFGDSGIILLKQLVDINIDDLSRKTGIPEDKLESLIRKAKEILSS
jgi:hypothetical protein